MHNWRRYPSSNWYEIDQKTRLKNRNIGAQLQSILYKLLKEDFGKFISCRTFGAHKFVHPEPFLDYTYTNFDTWCQR